MSMSSPTTTLHGRLPNFEAELEALRICEAEWERRQKAILLSELEKHEAEQERRNNFRSWLPHHIPEFNWNWPHLRLIHQKLQQITDNQIDRVGFMIPPQHGKTRSITVPYPVWRMLREPGLRVGILSHSQRYANKISRWCRKLALKAGAAFGEVARADEWEMTNGSTFIARGRGAALAGEPLDLCVIDDVFGSRQDADSPVIQEEAYEWYMDDVTPRLQKGAAIVLVNTRWGPGDLYGRIEQSEEAKEWDITHLKAIAEEGDVLGRLPGEALCHDRFPIDKLLQKQRVEGIGFESLYQGNPIPRGGTFFERRWLLGSDNKPILKSIEQLPLLSPMPFGRRLVRYWDLASSRNDSACYTSGVLLMKLGDGDTAEFWVCDVVRGRWMPAERNLKMREIAELDAIIPGYEKMWFESPVFDKQRAAARAIHSVMSGFACSADNVGNQGSKELRAEPVASAAKGGILKVVDGGWNAAFLTEIEGFPRTTYKDQVDSLSGAFNRLSRGGFAMSVG